MSYNIMLINSFFKCQNICRTYRLLVFDDQRSSNMEKHEELIFFSCQLNLDNAIGYRTVSKMS